MWFDDGNGDVTFQVGAHVPGFLLRVFRIHARIVAVNYVPGIFAAALVEFDHVPVGYFRIEHTLDIAFG